MVLHYADVPFRAYRYLTESKVAQKIAGYMEKLDSQGDTSSEWSMPECTTIAILRPDATVDFLACRRMNQVEALARRK